MPARQNYFGMELANSWYKHFNTMGSLLYIIAVILIIGWLLGFFVFHAGSIIHILLVIAVIAILLRLIRGRDAV